MRALTIAAERVPSEYCIEETIRRDLGEDIGFLVVFAAAVRKALEIVDMPDRRASLLVRLILRYACSCPKP